MRRTLLVTSALPYANGDIHLGHLLEAIQTDIWVRFQKMWGHDCYYLCADDAHGTAVMLRAEEAGVSPTVWIEQMRRAHLNDFNGFYIDFDHYHSTDSIENKTQVADLYQALRRANRIELKTIDQLYDPVKQLFLPDRFIKGECPRCASKDQYGDYCERCGSTYAPTDLRHPYSTVSGAVPVLRQSEHYFFKLHECEAFLKQWTSQPGTLQTEAYNKIQEWFSVGLVPWDISRDAPYFGIEIPDAPNKFFYVWLDAPVGYMAAHQAFCQKSGHDFNVHWKRDSSTELHHFIGKDILYFHALFWPAMLESACYRTPTMIHAHGFLTVNGKKMSKSRGTFITAQRYLAHLNPEWLRYYFASKLGAGVDDLDFNLEDFAFRVNSDLVGKYINIASRCAGFITQYFSGALAEGSVIQPVLSQTEVSGGALHFMAADGQTIHYPFAPHHPLVSIEGLDLLAALQAVADEIAASYEHKKYAQAVRHIMALADVVNRYTEGMKPWERTAELRDHQSLHAICSIVLAAFRLLTLYLKPVLPALAKNVEAFFNIPPLAWADVNTVLLDRPIRPYQHLMTRITPKHIEALRHTCQEGG